VPAGHTFRSLPGGLRLFDRAAAGTLAAIMAVNDATAKSPIILIVLILLVSLNAHSYSSARHGKHYPHRAGRFFILR
jgi:hypothetical protein